MSKEATSQDQKVGQGRLAEWSVSIFKDVPLEKVVEKYKHIPRILIESTWNIVNPKGIKKQSDEKDAPKTTV